MDEMPGVNASIDAYIAQGLNNHEYITLFDFPNAHHAVMLQSVVARELMSWNMSDQPSSQLKALRLGRPSVRINVNRFKRDP